MWELEVCNYIDKFFEREGLELDYSDFGEVSEKYLLEGLLNYSGHFIPVHNLYKHNKAKHKKLLQELKVNVRKRPIRVYGCWFVTCEVNFGSYGGVMFNSGVSFVYLYCIDCDHNVALLSRTLKGSIL